MNLSLSRINYDYKCMRKLVEVRDTGYLGRLRRKASDAHPVLLQLAPSLAGAPPWFASHHSVLG